MSTIKLGSGQPTSKKSIDEILGQAKNALSQSRQFRNPGTASQRSGLNNNNTTVPSKSNLTPPNQYENRSIVKTSSMGITKEIPKNAAIDRGIWKSDRNSARKAKNKEPEVALSVSSKAEDSSSNSSLSLAQFSDSTVTPPTITVTAGSSKAAKNKHSYSDFINQQNLVSNSSRSSNNQSTKIRRQPSDRNFIERTLLVRGDPVSQESYAVLKEMMYDKEQKLSGRTSYTEDWVSDVRSSLSQISSLEVPQTESEIPVDSQSDSNDDTIRDTASSVQLVDEISDILQDLEVSDKRFPDETLEKSALSADVNPSYKGKSANEDKSNSQKSSKLISTSTSSSDKVTSKASTSSKNSNMLSKRSGLSAKVSASSRSISSKTPSRHTISEASAKMSTVPSISRISSRKSFQRVLAKIKLEDERDPANVHYEPPRTKPQREIQSILEKEVYQKELKKLRSIQKKQETRERQLQELRVKDAVAALSETIKSNELVQTNVALPDFRQDPLALTEGITSMVRQKSSVNYGAPHFNIDGSLGMDYSDHNYPRSPVSDFNERVEQMDLPNLVREVLASNERMYLMAVGAAKEMGKQYGKNAKLLQKMKRYKRS